MSNCFIINDLTLTSFLKPAINYWYYFIPIYYQNTLFIPHYFIAESTYRQVLMNSKMACLKNYNLSLRFNTLHRDCYLIYEGF